MKSVLKAPPSLLFIYALAVSLLAYAYRSLESLALIAAVNGVLGIAYGYRYKLLWALMLISFWGTFINAVAVANTGPAVFQLGSLELREGAVKVTLAVSFRLLAILGATLSFIRGSEPHELAKALTAELRLPKGLAFAISYAIRLLPLMKRDYEEVVLARAERGYSRIPFLPGDVKSFVQPLLSIALERAVWAGVSAELRGFRLRRVKYKPVEVSASGLLILALLSVQIALPLFKGW